MVYSVQRHSTPWRSCSRCSGVRSSRSTPRRMNADRPHTSAPWGSPRKTGQDGRTAAVSVLRPRLTSMGSCSSRSVRANTRSTSAVHNAKESWGGGPTSSPSRRPTTGCTAVPVMAGRAVPRQTSRTLAMIGPSSSQASRRAASIALSPGSRWPPGKLTCTQSEDFL